MGLTYEAPPANGALRQGELLASVWEHQPLFPPKPIPTGRGVRVESVLHALAVVLSPDCDLLWDYEMRFLSFLTEDPAKVLDVEQHPATVTHVLLCDAYSHDAFRPRFKGSKDLWRRVDQNQDERYHHLTAAGVADSDLRLHDLYLDFKKVVAVRTDQMYDGLLGDHIERIALLPPYYLHDIIHRFYGFLSRVAVPDG
jgi:hypothetical protein